MATKYRLSVLKSQIDSDKPTSIFIHAVTAGGKVVGYLWLDVAEPAGYIHALYLEPEHRGKGLGTRMLERCFELCRTEAFATVGLSVNKENSAARALYERLGFLPYLNSQVDYCQLIKVL